MQELISVYKSLPRPESSENVQSFTAVQLEGTSHRIGKDTSGWPAILLKGTLDQTGARIRLEHLDVQHSVRCRVTSGQNTEENLYTVIRCTEADDELAQYFLHTVEPVLKLLGSTPTFKEISSAISHLVELFRALTQPPIKSVIGLWAELFVIQNSKNTLALLQAWHATPEEKYDFSSGSQRIEVKSTSRRERVHHFSLEQLTPPSGCRVVVASLFVERNGGGISLREIIEEMRKDLTTEPDLQERLDRVVALTLGNALRQGYAARFDRELAQESLSFFDSVEIPKIQEPLPLNITDVHFKSNLSQCPPLTHEILARDGGIFAFLIR